MGKTRFRSKSLQCFVIVFTLARIFGDDNGARLLVKYSKHHLLCDYFFSQLLNDCHRGFVLLDHFQQNIDQFNRNLLHHLNALPVAFGF